MKKYQLPIILTSLSIGILSFLLPIYSKELNMSALEITYLFSIISIVNLLLRPLIGYALDKYGRKKFLVLACFIYSLSMITFAFSINSSILFIARFIQAIASSIFLITIYTISIDLAKDDKATSIGFFQGASSKGALYGSIFGFTFLAYSESWRNLFIIYSLAAFIAGIYTIVKLKETKSQDVIEKKREKINVNKIIIVLMILTFLSSLTASMLSPIFIIYLQDKFTTDISFLAIAFLPAAIIYSIFPTKAGKYIHKKGCRISMIIGLTLSFIVTILIVNINDGSILIVLWALEAVGITLLTVARKTLISNITGIKDIGKRYGIFMIAVGIGGTIGPIIGGLLYDNVSNSFPFYLDALISFISIIIITILVPKTSDIIKEK